MAYNFKSIADVEVVAEPAESANVLIEENGVIKKAPKTAVGGAGETLVIAFNGNNWVNYGDYSGYEVISAPDNLYELTKEMFETLTYVNIILYTISENSPDIIINHLTQMCEYENYYRFVFDWKVVDCYRNGGISIYYWD